MEKEDILEAIRSITQDIDLLVQHTGGLSIFDPSTELHNLVTIRLRLRLLLYRVAGEDWVKEKNLITCIDKK